MRDYMFLVGGGGSGGCAAPRRRGVGIFLLSPRILRVILHASSSKYIFAKPVRKQNEQEHGKNP